MIKIKLYSKWHHIKDYGFFDTEKNCWLKDTRDKSITSTFTGNKDFLQLLPLSKMMEEGVIGY